MFSREELEAASHLVHEIVPPTPQFRWPLLAKELGCEVWVKHENHSPRGAFKVRGGITFMTWLKANRPEVKGVIAATRGNHGQSVALAANRAGLTATIVVPHGNSSEKNAAMQALGAELIVHGDDFQAALEEAQRLAKARELFPIPSFHKELVRGVATYGLELFTAAPDLTRVYVPIGLGSGICGVIAARDALGLKTEIVGVVSSAAPAYALSFERGQLVEHPATTALADGMACRTPNAEALEIIWKKVARIVQVGDEDIAAAMRLYFSATHSVAEGAGAAALAAAMKDPRKPEDKIGLVLSGGNVDRQVFPKVLAEEQA